MDMGNMPGMSPTSTSSSMANMIMSTPSPSTTMSGTPMASLIATSPQAGMATSMAEIKNMCTLPGMEHMCNTHTHELVGACAALLALATTAVMLRLLSRRLSALTFWWDDVMIIASLMVSYACSALTFVDANNGVGRHFETVPQSSVNMLFKTTVAYQILYAICITLVKVSILLFYYRLFGVRKQFKITVFVVLGFVGAWCIAIVLVDIFQCVPVQAAWIRPYPNSKCINNNATLLGTAITNVVLDVAILVLPLSPIWNLALTVRQKVTLSAIFFVGAFTCAAAIVRVWAILNIDQTDVTWSYVRPMTWTTVEISIGITCACLPTLQPLGRACFGNCIARTQTSQRRRREGRKSERSRLQSESPTGGKMGLAASSSARRSPSRDFYRLEKQFLHADGGRGGGKGGDAFVTSVWASKEELGVGGNERRSDDSVWTKGIHIKQEIEMGSEGGGSAYYQRA